MTLSSEHKLFSHAKATAKHKAATLHLSSLLRQFLCLLVLCVSQPAYTTPCALRFNKEKSAETLIVEIFNTCTGDVVGVKDIACEGAYLVIGTGSETRRYKRFYSVITGRPEPDPKTSNISLWILTPYRERLQLTKSHHYITFLTPVEKNITERTLSKKLINEYNQIIMHSKLEDLHYFLLSTVALGGHRFEHFYGVIDTWQKITKKW